MQVGRTHIFYRGVITHKAKALTCALVLAGFASAAQADDPKPSSTGSMKDTEPALTAAGVTVYGAVDVGYAYQTHGAPISGALATGLQYNMFGSATSRKHISSIAPNGLSNSFLGVKVEEALGGGWTAIAKLESGFVPTSGELADGCASLSRMNGLPQIAQISKGDSSRCGQIFNQGAWGGVSNASYGTLTAGRQNTLNLELEAAYDPMALSYAFSLIGYSGSAGAGYGDTEDARWDNSVKYVYQYGPIHVAGMYAQGARDTALRGDGWAANAGATFWGFSVDGVYTKENSAISSATMSAAQCAAVGLTQPACAATKILSGTISDNTGWTVAAKYTFDFSGGGGLKDGGLKDSGCCCTGSADDPWWCGKLTFYAAYQHVEQDNPAEPVLAGTTTLNGYVLGAVNNTNFNTSKILETWWAGAKYDFPANWSIAGVYYRLDQNSWINSAHNNCPQQTAANRANPAFVGFVTGSNCSGNLNMGSFLIDYAVNKYFDIYTGVNYSTVDGGLRSGFFVDNSFLYMTGARLRF